MEKKEKGVIDTSGATDEQRFKLMNEFIERVEKDALNIKPAEINAMRDILVSLEGKFDKLIEFKGFIMPKMTKSQETDYIKTFVSKEARERLIEDYLNKPLHNNCKGQTNINKQ